MSSESGFSSEMEPPAAVINIQLPSEAFRELAENDSSTGLLFTVYSNATLFQVAPDSSEEGFVVGTAVVGAIIEGVEVTNLTDPVVIDLEVVGIEVGFEYHISFFYNR